MYENSFGLQSSNKTSGYIRIEIIKYNLNEKFKIFLTYDIEGWIHLYDSY